MERCRCNAIEVHLKNLVHAMVMYLGHSPAMLLMVWTRIVDIVFATISCRPSFIRGIRYCTSYIPDQARPREFACELAWWAHSHTRGSCVGKYHASTPSRTKQGPKAMERNGRHAPSLSFFLLTLCNLYGYYVRHVWLVCATCMVIMCGMYGY